jgi:hypothetical protein
VEIDVPGGIIASGLSGHLRELIAVVGLRGGSMVTGGLPSRGLANVAFRGWSDDFTFIIGDHRYRCPSSVAQFLSPRVSELNSIDATISELRLEVDDRDELFGSVLQAAKGNSIAVDSDHRGTLEAICATLWNSELCKSVYLELGGEVTVKSVTDPLQFLSGSRSNPSTELEFIASHFYDFLYRRDRLKALSFSMIYEILGHGSLRIDSEDGRSDFISESIETDAEMFGLLEFVRLEFCSTEVMNNFLDLLSERFGEINASVWAGLHARLVLADMNWKQFPPSAKKRKAKNLWGTKVDVDVPDGIIARLTRECGGNVHDEQVVNITSGSFEKERQGDNPHSGARDNRPEWAAKNAADLETGSLFISDYRSRSRNISHTGINWLCYPFEERRIVPTHYAIRTNCHNPGNEHLKSWLVETSVDRDNWREVAREEDNKKLNGILRSGIFAVAGGWACRFIRLVNIGRNHFGDDCLWISAWEILGNLLEYTILPMSISLSTRAGGQEQGERTRTRRSPPILRFDLVAGVTSKSIMSHSCLRPPSVVIVQILQ